MQVATAAVGSCSENNTPPRPLAILFFLSVPLQCTMSLGNGEVNGDVPSGAEHSVS